MRLVSHFEGRSAPYNYVFLTCPPIHFESVWPDLARVKQVVGAACDAAHLTKATCIAGHKDGWSAARVTALLRLCWTTFPVEKEAILCV